MEPPCKDCQQRKIGCHAKCEEYLAYAILCREQNERVAKAKNIESDFYAVSTRRRKKER